MWKRKQFGSLQKNFDAFDRDDNDDDDDEEEEVLMVTSAVFAFPVDKEANLEPR